MKATLFSLCVGVSVASTALAQDTPVLLFPQGAPGETVKMVESADRGGGKVAGETVLRITNVSEPTITVYQAPQEVASGSAMIVCPGGGYSILAYDLEGDEVCEWLNNIGVTAVLLKYRVPAREGRARYEAPLQDLQRAVGYIRAHADEMNLDPERIGVMGFSAGAHLSALLSNHYDTRTYPEVDACDKVSCRPDFCLLVYPAYLAGEKFQIAPELKVTSTVPPTMLVQAEDDKAYVNSSLFYYYALKEAGVPARLHLYSEGGHGYGLRDTGADVNEWPDRAEDWLRGMGVID